MSTESPTLPLQSAQDVSTGAPWTSEALVPLQAWLTRHGVTESTMRHTLRGAVRFVHHLLAPALGVQAVHIVGEHAVSPSTPLPLFRLDTPHLSATLLVEEDGVTTLSVLARAGHVFGLDLRADVLSDDDVQDPTFEGMPPEWTFPRYTSGCERFTTVVNDTEALSVLVRLQHHLQARSSTRGYLHFTPKAGSAPHDAALEVGYYLATPRFRAIVEHVAVMRPDGALVAVVGPSGDAESFAYAQLFAGSSRLARASRGVMDFIDAGTAVHPGSDVAIELGEALKDAGAR